MNGEKLKLLAIMFLCMENTGYIYGPAGFIYQKKNHVLIVMYSSLAVTFDLQKGISTLLIDERILF